MTVEAVAQATPTFGEKVKNGITKAANWFGHTIRTGWTKTSEAISKLWNKFQTFMAGKFPYFGTPQGQKVLLAATVATGVVLAVGLVAVTVLALRSSYKGDEVPDPVTT